MPEFRLRPEAISDLESIWDYTADKWGEDQADRYLRMIDKGFGDIVDKPDRGRRCDHIRKGYWKYAVGRHVIYYRAASFGPDIIRVLHRSMDVDRHL